MLRCSFAALFKDRLDSYVRKPETLNWRKQSKFNYFTDENLLDVIDLKAERPHAISLDRRSHLAVLRIRIEDIDLRHSIQAGLVKHLRAIGVEKPCAYNVNELGEVNLYLCFDEAFDGAVLHPLLKNWLMHCELDEVVELVGIGEPLELPLQKDFVWTTNYSTPLIKRVDIATDPAIAMFLSNLSKGLLRLEEVSQALSQFPIILPEEPVLEEEEEPIPFTAEELAFENIVSLARRRVEKSRRKEPTVETVEESIIQAEESNSINCDSPLESKAADLIKDLSDAVAVNEYTSEYDCGQDDLEPAYELDFEPGSNLDEEDDQPLIEEDEPTESGEHLSAGDFEEDSIDPDREALLDEKALEDEDAQNLLEEMLDFDLNDIPVNPKSARIVENQYGAEAVGDSTYYRHDVQSRSSMDSDYFHSAESTMLPPPGATSFRQLTLPFVFED